ncbi:MAG: AI-2E family transporter [Chloroflexaceae bacterium]|nr:AI-2E family transporter [Chloroflexaceae bacterium]
MNHDNDQYSAPTNGPFQQPVLEPAADTSRSRNRRLGFSWRTLIRWLLVLLAVYFIGWLLWNAGAVLLPFIIGLVVAYLILPIVNRLEQYLPRWAAILIVYALGGIVVLTGVTFLVPPLVEQTAAAAAQVQIPSVEDLEEQAADFLAVYRRNVPEEIRVELERSLSSAAGTMRENLTLYVQGVGGFLLNRVLQLINTITFLFGLIVVPFWIFYVLNDQQAGQRRLNTMLHPAVRADFWAILTIIDRIFSGYIRGQLVLGFAVALASWIGLTALSLAGFEVRYTLLLAVIAGFTELIPLVGPVLGAIPAVIMGLVSDSPTAALAILVLYIGIQQLEAQILVPRIIGESVGLHPAILMVVLVVAGQVLGLLGVILAAPLAAAGRDIFRYIYGRLNDPPRPAGVLPEG